MVDLLNFLSVASCLYSAGACICRMRHPSKEIKTLWKLLHVAAFALALSLLAAVVEQNATTRELAITFLLAAYVAATQKSWSNGVPGIARSVPEKG